MVPPIPPDESQHAGRPDVAAEPSEGRLADGGREPGGEQASDQPPTGVPPVVDSPHGDDLGTGDPHIANDSTDAIDLTGAGSASPVAGLGGTDDSTDLAGTDGTDDADGTDGTGSTTVADRDSTDGQGGPVVLPEGLGEVPAGAWLCQLLDETPTTEVAGGDVVELVAAAYRQLCRQQAVFFQTVLETALRAPFSIHTVERLDEPGEFAADEVRARLVWSRSRAESTLVVSHQLFVEFPQLGEVMLAGELDLPRAKAFLSWTQGLSDEHAHAIVDQLLPSAGDMTVGELIDEIKRACLAVDPGWAEARYREAVTQRRVRGFRNPDGTGNLAGYNQPVDRVVAATARIDTLARECKRSGDRRRIDLIRSDLFLRMLDGSFETLSDAEIVAYVLDNPLTQPGDPDPNADPAPDAGQEPDTSGEPDDSGPESRGEPGDDGPGSGEGLDEGDPDHGHPDDGGPDNGGPDNGAYGSDDGLDDHDPGDDDSGSGGGADDGGQGNGGPGSGGGPKPYADPEAEASPPAGAANRPEGTRQLQPPTAASGQGGQGLSLRPVFVEPTADAAPNAPPPGEPSAAPRDIPEPSAEPELAAQPEPVLATESTGAVRAHVPWAVPELRVELAMLLGYNDHPAQLPGWDYLPAHVARDLVARMGSAEWRWVVCDNEGRAVDTGITRARPATGGGSGGSRDRRRVGRRRHNGVPRDSRRGGIVELAVTTTELDSLPNPVRAGIDTTEDDSALAAWRAVIADVETQYAARTAEHAAPGESPPKEDQRPAAGGRDRRTPGPRLRRWLQVRDRVCVFPHCRVPAAQADIDHRVRWADTGRTDGHNCGPLCRHDHRAKDEAGWSMLLRPDGAVVWTSLLGQVLERRPPPVIARPFTPLEPSRADRRTLLLPARPEEPARPEYPGRPEDPGPRPEDTGRPEACECIMLACSHRQRAASQAERTDKNTSNRYAGWTSVLEYMHAQSKAAEVYMPHDPTLPF